MLPEVAPRLISILRQQDPADPVRIYSGATESGKLARISLFPNNEGRPPASLIAQADEKLRVLAAKSNRI